MRDPAQPERELLPTTQYWYTLDGHGSVSGLTDNSGNVVATYQYDPYGQVTAMTGATIATNNPWRYVGAYQDGTGLYHLDARYYDPTTGRFTQQDQHTTPLDPKSWNRYTYSGGDPINFMDPTGNDACTTATGATAAAGTVYDGGLAGAEVFTAVGAGETFGAALLGVITGPLVVGATVLVAVLVVTVVVLVC